MAAGNAIERAYKNISEIANFMLAERYFPYILFLEGSNFLTPEQALAYSRIRYLDSDFGRTNRQRNVLTSLLNSVKNMNTDQMTQLVNKILPMLTTDMTNADITGYMVKILPILPELEITTQHIPASGTYKSCYVRGMAVLVPDLAANRAILQETLN